MKKLKSVLYIFILSVLVILTCGAEPAELPYIEKPLPYHGTTPREAAISLFRLDPELVDISNQIYENIVKMEPELYLQNDVGITKLNSWDDMTQAELEAVKLWAADITGDCNTADEKIYAVMEYVASNVYYDMDFYNNYDGSPEQYEQLLNHNAYDVLTNKTAVCYGYSATASALLQISGVPCVIIESPDHAWNMAYNGERWVLFDTTWISCNRYVNGEFNTNPDFVMEWFDFTLEDANSNQNHLIEGADYCEYNNTIYKAPIYTAQGKFEIPDSVTKIEDSVFCCAGDLVITGNFRNIISIGNQAFRECTGLEAISSLENAAYIGEAAFYGCASLEGIVKLGKLNNIESYTFFNCTGLDGIQGTENVSSIGYGAFYGCTGLEDISSLENAAYIGEVAFYGCTSLDGIVKFGKLNKIESRAFFNCSSLDGVQGTENVSSIGYGAFYGCSQLTGVLDFRSMQGIGAFAFDITNLTKVYIPNDSITIGECAFQRCPVTIYANQESAARDYANANRIPFEDINTLVFTITYDADGGSFASEDTVKKYGEKAVISEVLPQKKGFEFIAWSSSSGGKQEYFPGDEYTSNCDITLYALWNKIIYGDANGDGEVKLSDAIRVLQCIAASVTETLPNGIDVNGNGTIELSDVIRILQHIANPDVILG